MDALIVSLANALVLAVMAFAWKREMKHAKDWETACIKWKEAAEASTKHMLAEQKNFREAVKRHCMGCNMNIMLKTQENKEGKK